MISSSKKYLPTHCLPNGKLSENFLINHYESNMVEIVKCNVTERAYAKLINSFSSDFFNSPRNTEIEKNYLKCQYFGKQVSNSSLTDFNRFKTSGEHIFSEFFKKDLTNFNIRSHEKNIFYLERYKKKIYTSAYIVFWIEKLFDNYELNKINTVLSDIDIQFLEEWSIVALLRSTYSAKSHLPAWNDFYNNSKSYLEYLGKEDVEGILIGLDR